MTFRNLTPHRIDLVRETTETGCELVAWEPVCVWEPDEAGPARIEAGIQDTGTVPSGGVDVPMGVRRTGALTGLPEQREGTLLIVSTLVAEACPHRGDLVSPGDLVRDADGQPIGCTCLVWPSSGGDI